jgi:hypothetical protein
MVMGLWPTLHHENQRSSPLRRRLDTSMVCGILWFGSMNYIEREVEGLRPDVAMIAAARQRLDIYDYTGRLMRALGLPRVVFATHWDEQSFPFGVPQDERLREAEVFVQEVKRVSPRTRVILPRHLERHTLPPKRTRRRA